MIKSIELVLIITTLLINEYTRSAPKWAISRKFICNQKRLSNRGAKIMIIFIARQYKTLIFYERSVSRQFTSKCRFFCLRFYSILKKVPFHCGQAL